MILEPSENDIKIVRGTTNVIDIYLSSGSGEPYELGENEVLKFGVKKNENDMNYILYKELTEDDYDETKECYILRIDVSDTSGIDFNIYGDSYVYDMGVQSGEDFYNAVCHANFTLDFNITKWEEGGGEHE